MCDCILKNLLLRKGTRERQFMLVAYSYESSQAKVAAMLLFYLFPVVTLTTGIADFDNQSVIRKVISQVNQIHLARSTIVRRQRIYTHFYKRNKPSAFSLGVS